MIFLWREAAGMHTGTMRCLICGIPVRVAAMKRVHAFVPRWCYAVYLIIGNRFLGRNFMLSCAWRHSIAHYPQSTLHISTLSSLHSTFRILQSTPHNTFHTQQSTLNFTLHTPHHTPFSTHHTSQSAIYSAHSPLLFHTLHSNSTLYIVHSTLHFPLHTLHPTLPVLHYTLPTLYTPHFARTPHSTCFTVHTPHSTVYNCTLTVGISGRIRNTVFQF